MKHFTQSTQTAAGSARSPTVTVSAGRMARPRGRQAGARSPLAARPVRAPRRGPRWSRSTSRTPTAATSDSSPGHRTATRITFRPGHPMAGRSSSSATPAAAAHQGRRSSWPSTSSPGRSGSSTGSPAGRRAPASPPSHRMGSGSSSGSGASMATHALPVHARQETQPWPLSILTGAACDCCG